MAVKVERYHSGCMAEAFRDRFGVYPLLQVQRGHGVPEIVQADAFKTNPPGQSPESQG